MTGSLQKKNGRYHVVTYFHGKPKWIATGIPINGNHIRKAQQRMRDILSELEQQKTDINNDILFLDYLKLWLGEEKIEVELNTWETYEMYIISVIEPHFKKLKIKLRDVSPQDIKSFFTYLQKGTDGKKPKSVESIRKYCVCLNGALKMAMENNLIAYNPVERTTLKKISR